MSTPKRASAAQKKKRLLQLRDAQRRRRERLKDDSQHFVQIILPENILAQLREIVSTTGETLQHVIGCLIEQSLGMQHTENGVAKHEQNTLTEAPRSMAISKAEDIAYTPLAEEVTETELVVSDRQKNARNPSNEEGLASLKPVNQLDLFG